MYEEVQKYNRRMRGRNIENSVKLINVIDGGGWLARKNDLRKIFEECDYCFAFSGLSELINLIKQMYRE